MAEPPPPTYALYTDPLIPHPDSLVCPAHRPEKSKNVHVVWVGRDVGIFLTWDDAERCVKGVPRARYKSFKTWMKAQYHYAECYRDMKVQRVDIEPLATGQSSDDAVPVSSRDPTPAPGHSIWPITIPSSPGDHAGLPIVVHSSPIRIRQVPTASAAELQGHAPPGPIALPSMQTIPPSSLTAPNLLPTRATSRRAAALPHSPAPVRQAPPSSPTPVRHAPPASSRASPRTQPLGRSPPLSRVLFPRAPPHSQAPSSGSGSRTSHRRPSRQAAEEEDPLRLTRIQSLIDRLANNTTTLNINVNIHVSPTRESSIPAPSPRTRLREPSVELDTNEALTMFSDLLTSPPSSPALSTLTAVDEDDWGGHLTTADREHIDEYRYRTPSPVARSQLGPHY